MLRVSALAAACALCALAGQPVARYRHHAKAFLNDSKVTPGAASSRTKAELCDPSFRTAAIRDVPETLKRRVCAEYGLANCHGVEVDHLESLELGGTNDIHNLWPQPYAPAPGARQKDVLEDYLHRAVCRGDMTLKAAQQGISSDWYALYVQLGLDKPK